MENEIFLNGKSILDKPERTIMEPEICHIYISCNPSPGGWGTEWTVGEIIAIGGILNDVTAKDSKVIWHIIRIRR